MTTLLIIIVGITIQVAGLVWRRSGHAMLLIGVGGIIAGAARPGSWGTTGIIGGVVALAIWWNRRRRDPARRAIGGKARAVVAVMTRTMRQAAPRPAPGPAR
jgi:hypothetical protein